ncbi:MAG: glycine zipper domain-containing protein [Planctomycetaceae bacterium]
MPVRRSAALAVMACLAVATAGCMSPYYRDRGALFGGATGAGVGALVGEAVGDPLAGAVIGGAVGTITGAAVGDSLDAIEARNRAEIEARLGRPVPVGAVTIPDVIAMTQAGVSEAVIANHVRIHGPAAPLTTADIIHLQQNGVSSQVVAAMQQPAPRPATVIHEPPPPVVIIEDGPFHDPWRHPYHHRRHWHGQHHHHHPSWGASIQWSSD